MGFVELLFFLVWSMGCAGFPYRREQAGASMCTSLFPGLAYHKSIVKMNTVQIVCNKKFNFSRQGAKMQLAQNERFYE